MSTLRSFSCLLVASFMAATGCSSSPNEEAESSEQGHTVRPTGNGELASVTIRLPSQFVADVPALGARFNFWWNGTWIAPNTKSSVVTNKNWNCLTVTLDKPDPAWHPASRLASSTECLFQVEPYGELTIDLSLLKLWWSGRPHLDAAMVLEGANGSAVLSRHFGGKRYPKWTNAEGKYPLVGWNDVALPVVPGSYTYELVGSTLPKHDFAVGTFEQVDQNAHYGDYLSQVKVSYADTEGFTTVGSPEVRITCSRRSSAVNADGKREDRSIAVVVAQEAPTRCAYTVNSFSSPFDLPRGPSELALSRLNVDHVAILDEGGRKVAGSYQIRRKNEDGTWSSYTTHATTGTGRDVPRGHYEVVITYVAHGEVKWQVHEVDL